MIKLETIINKFLSDPELAEQCLTACRLSYLDCLWRCDTAYCSEQCGKRFQVCLDGCPCGADCPGGCAGCDNPICPEQVREEETFAEKYLTLGFKMSSFLYNFRLRAAEFGRHRRRSQRRSNRLFRKKTFKLLTHLAVPNRLLFLILFRG